MTHILCERLCCDSRPVPTDKYGWLQKVKLLGLLIASTAIFLAITHIQNNGQRTILRAVTTKHSSPLDSGVSASTSDISTIVNPVTASWDNFDRIVCLNVLERPERLAHAKQEFEKVGILDSVDFRIAPRRKNGCFEAHWNAIHEGFQDGLDNILIFEDDVVFNEGWQQVIKDTNGFVKEEPDWEYLNIGYDVHYVEESRTNPNIVNGKSASAHAFSMSRRGMQLFLERFPSSTSNAGMEADVTCMVFLPHTFFHKNYQAITQMRKELGTDNSWDFLEAVPGIETDYKTFIQNVFMPKAIARFADLSMGQFAYWSWQCRPWLMPDTASMGHPYQIQVYRNGQLEKFPWRLSFLGDMITVAVGLHQAITMPVPDHISRVKMFWYLWQL